MEPNAYPPAYTEQKQKKADIMKIKILKIFFVAVLVLLALCGCNSLGEYSEPNDRRLVSVIGFDNHKGKIRVTAEVLEATDSGGMSPYLLSGDGDNVREVLSEISVQSPQELSFTHCSALILGKELTKEQTDMILEYCTENDSISLSAKIVSANNAEDLLSLKAEGAVSSGFAVADIIENTAKKFGYGGHTALYEIKTARMQTANVYALPFFYVKEDKPYQDGMLVYVNDEGVMQITREESISYAVMRNTYDGGEVFSEGQTYSVSDARSKIKASFENGRLVFNISIYSNPQRDELSDIVEIAVMNFDTDIFGIANTLVSRYPEIWDKVKADYSSYYKNAEFIIGEG